MKSKPIIFNGEMVRAILKGRKTQTRRVIKFMKPEWEGKVINLPKIEKAIMYSGNEIRFYDNTGCWTYTRSCPYGWFGYELWVRETWMKDEGKIYYRADLHPDENEIKWKSPIHLRKVDSRISLRIVKVRVERIQEIDNYGIINEGVEPDLIGNASDLFKENGVIVDKSFEYPSDFAFWKNPKEKFIQLWNSINAKKGYGWSENPWVWVVEFERIDMERE